MADADIRWLQRLETYELALATLKRVITLTASRPLSELKQQDFCLVNPLDWRRLQVFISKTPTPLFLVLANLVEHLYASDETSEAGIRPFQQHDDALGTGLVVSQRQDCSGVETKGGHHSSAFRSSSRSHKSLAVALQARH